MPTPATLRKRNHVQTPRSRNIPRQTYVAPRTPALLLRGVLGSTPKFRQQTLTQIEFVIPLPEPDEDDLQLEDEAIYDDLPDSRSPKKPRMDDSVEQDATTSHNLRNHWKGGAEATRERQSSSAKLQSTSEPPRVGHSIGDGGASPATPRKTVLKTEIPSSQSPTSPTCSARSRRSHVPQQASPLQEKNPNAIFPRLKFSSSVTPKSLYPRGVGPGQENGDGSVEALAADARKDTVIESKKTQPPDSGSPNRSKDIRRVSPDGRSHEEKAPAPEQVPPPFSGRVEIPDSDDEGEFLLESQIDIFSRVPVDDQDQTILNMAGPESTLSSEQELSEDDPRTSGKASKRPSFKNINNNAGETNESPARRPSIKVELPSPPAKTQRPATYIKPEPCNTSPSSSGRVKPEVESQIESVWQPGSHADANFRQDELDLDEREGFTAPMLPPRVPLACTPLSQRKRRRGLLQRIHSGESMHADESSTNSGPSTSSQSSLPPNLGRPLSLPASQVSTILPTQLSPKRNLTNNLPTSQIHTDSPSQNTSTTRNSSGTRSGSNGRSRRAKRQRVARAENAVILIPSSSPSRTPRPKRSVRARRRAEEADVDLSSPPVPPSDTLLGLHEGNVESNGRAPRPSRTNDSRQDQRPRGRCSSGQESRVPARNEDPGETGLDSERVTIPSWDHRPLRDSQMLPESIMNFELAHLFPELLSQRRTMGGGGEEDNLEEDQGEDWDNEEEEEWGEEREGEEREEEGKEEEDQEEECYDHDHIYEIKDEDEL